MSLPLPLRVLCAALLCAGVAACAVGPDYHRPAIALPAQFSEAVPWQRAAADPAGGIEGQWWQLFGDPQLDALEQQALDANTSIAAAEASYRQAQAVVAADRAGLFPTLGLNAESTRAHGGAIISGAGLASSKSGAGDVSQNVSTTLSASWEPDLWGRVRRQVEAGRAQADAAQAVLAGARLSISASVASAYFSLRQLDGDIVLLSQQQDIEQRLLEITRLAVQQGTASNDQLLQAQDALQTTIAVLQLSQTAREQSQHALAVLLGRTPESFSLPVQTDYVFNAPTLPAALPSELLQRRPDVVEAERAAAAANAQIGVAKAAFFPSLTLSADGGYQHDSWSQLFALPNRIWTLGPQLAQTLFDGGARRAALHEAQASYDAQAASYRGTVLAALQNVEDNLSSLHHLSLQGAADERIYAGNRGLFASSQAQLAAGIGSEQSVLTQQLILLQAEQTSRDISAQVVGASVGLIESLGGGWQGPSVGSAAHKTDG
ncbi:MAG: efflux transporter outer membrane subunit [Dyella sp.]